MMDDDIKILEEFISNYKNVQEKYKDDEIQAEIERSCYFEEVPAIQIENLLKAYKNTQIQLQEQKNINKKLNKENQLLFDALMDDERIINKMAKYLVGFPIVPDDDDKDIVRFGDESEIIEHFRKECE